MLWLLANILGHRVPVYIQYCIVDVIAHFIPKETLPYSLNFSRGKSSLISRFFDQPRKFYPRNICLTLQFNTVLMQSTKILTLKNFRLYMVSLLQLTTLHGVHNTL